MKVLIITGGISSERKISLLSAKEVKKALEVNQFQVKVYDLKYGYQKLKKETSNVDVVFPVIHGEEGEGGKLHKFLSKLETSFIGGDPEGMRRGWHKISFKKFCQEIGVNTPLWRIIKSQQDIIKFGFPCVLKSSSGGSSREVVILKTAKDIKSRVSRKLLSSQYNIFVEKFIKGVEVTVGIIGSKALPVVEIIPPEGGWFDYKNKYSGVTKEIPYAPSLSSKLQKEIQKIALKIHQTLSLGCLSRIDFIVSANVPYVLEVNTIPGLTSESLLPKAAQAAGIVFPKLVKNLVEMGT